MVLTKNQKRLLKIGIAESTNVLKNAATMDEFGASWELWFAYDAISNVYHQLRDIAIAKKKEVNNV